MKKGILRVFCFALLLSLLYISIISALPFTSEDVKNSPITKALEFYVLGLKDISTLSPPWDYWAVIIIFAMIWLILAAAFTDILVLFSPFSRRISIIIGIALTFIAVNLGAIQTFVSHFIFWLSAFGTASVLIGLGSAFAAFLALSIGYEPIARWALNRKARMHAHRGQLDIAHGIRLFARAGREERRAGERNQGGYGGQGPGGGI